MRRPKINSDVRGLPNAIMRRLHPCVDCKERQTSGKRCKSCHSIYVNSIYVNSKRRGLR